MKKLFVILGISAILVLVSGFISFMAVSKKNSALPREVGELVFIGISSEATGAMLSSDRNNVFWSGNSGTGAAVHFIVPTYFPSLNRVGGDFLVPDRDSLLVLDKSLRIKDRLDIPGLGVGVQALETSSASHKYVGYTFNVGSELAPDARKVVIANNRDVRHVDRDRFVAALTVCDSGLARWIEFEPSDANNLSGPGVGFVVAWTQTGEITERKINWEFLSIPDSESALSCQDDSGLIITEGRDGGTVVINVKVDREEFQVSKETPLKDFSPAAMARFSEVMDNKLYSLDHRQVLSVIDLESGLVEQREQLKVDGASPVAMSFDGDQAYVVVRPREFDHDQAVVAVDLKDIRCMSEPIRLVGYDQTPGQSLLARMGGSYMAVSSVLPIDQGFEIACREN